MNIGAKYGPNHIRLFQIFSNRCSDLSGHGLSLQTPFYEILGNDLFLSVDIFILTEENNKQVCLVRHHKVFKNKSFKDNFRNSF